MFFILRFLKRVNHYIICAQFYVYKYLACIKMKKENDLQTL